MTVGEPLLKRPRDPGEVLDRAALLIRGTYPQMFRALLIGYLPWSTLIALTLVPGAERMSSGEALSSEAINQHILWIVVYLIVDMVLLRQFMRGWLFTIAGAWMRGLAVTNGEAAAMALRRFPSLAMCTVLTGGLLGAIMPLGATMATQEPAIIGVVMLLVPLMLLVGLPIVLMGYVATAVVQLERRGPLAAVVRSVRLCGGSFGMVLVVAIVLVIVRFLSGLMPGLATNLWVQTALASMMASGLVILDVAVETVLYYTLRCRREDYDLELMSKEVELCGAEELESVERSLESPRFGAIPSSHTPRS